MRNDPLLFIGVVFGTMMWIIVTSVWPAPAADLPIPPKTSGNVQAISVDSAGKLKRAPMPKSRPLVPSDRAAGMP